MNDIYARAAADIAREAGEFLKHFSDSHELRVENKGSDLDFVTNADKQCQAMIAERLRTAFPNHRFIGEEDCIPDQEIGRMIEAGGEDDWFWICDPLDGTDNYIHHLGVYSVSIGLVHKGRSVAGAICLPEWGDIFCAARGEGAYLNGAPIHASACASLREAHVAGDIPVVDLELRGRYMQWLANVSAASANLRLMGSACYAISMVASGRQDAYFSMGVHPWDVAAGIVLLEEAGGVKSNVFSEPFRFDMTGGFLCCAPGLEGAFRGLMKEA